MRTILILGAGLSTSSLIRYLLDHAGDSLWKVRVGDIHSGLAGEKVQDHPYGESFVFDVYDDHQRTMEIRHAHLVISMLPARMHYLVADSCVKIGRNLVTASYLEPRIRALDEAARKRGILIMSECGVDPGIDHMSAMQMLHRIREEGGKLMAFESSTGGLVAPGYENNPWPVSYTHLRAHET